MRTNSVLILVIAIVMGGVAAFLARNWLLSRTHVATNTRTIIAAAKRLPYGTELRPDNVERIPWAAKNLPQGAFTSETELFKKGRRITLATIEADEPILKSKITGPGQRASLSTLLSNDKRAITIRVDDIRGVAGFVLPNDRVDVVLIRRGGGPNGQKDVSDLLMQDVKVIAVDQITSQHKDRPVVAKAVTLEVTPFQAQKIALASTIGHLSLILRRSGDTHIVNRRQVTETELFEIKRRPSPKSVESVATKTPVAAKKYDPVPQDVDATVSIVRDLKTEDYKVLKDKE